jgi:hypothetical protein
MRSLSNTLRYARTAEVRLRLRLAGQPLASPSSSRIKAAFAETSRRQLGVKTLLSSIPSAGGDVGFVQSYGKNTQNRAANILVLRGGEVQRDGLLAWPARWA